MTTISEIPPHVQPLYRGEELVGWAGSIHRGERLVGTVLRYGDQYLPFDRENRGLGTFGDLAAALEALREAFNRGRS
jgi:hypothetical protein